MPHGARVKGVVALLEQSVRLIHSAEHAHGLVPAQWTALRYFSTASPHHRTTAGLMRFQNMAMSPVGRTVRSLVDKGLVMHQPNPRDGRSDLIELTDEGRRFLEVDPARNLEALLGDLPPEVLAAFASGLQATIQGLLEQDVGARDQVD